MVAICNRQPPSSLTHWERKLSPASWVSPNDPCDMPNPLASFLAFGSMRSKNYASNMGSSVLGRLSTGSVPTKMLASCRNFKTPPHERLTLRLTGQVQIDMPEPGSRPIAVPRCGRCKHPVAPHGFGPGDGQEGDTIHACDQHRADAERWHAERYGRQPLQSPRPQQQRTTQALPGRPSDPGNGDLFGG